jgi:hypothetical protein
MSWKLVLDAPKHPARDASIHSMRCVEQGLRDEWLSVWVEDGIIEDPVGSPFDPDDPNEAGSSYQGIEKIAAFYDRNMAPNDIRFCIRSTFACGSECLNVGTITTKAPGGYVLTEEIAALYRVNEEGKTMSLRIFWELDGKSPMAFVF